MAQLFGTLEATMPEGVIGKCLKVLCLCRAVTMSTRKAIFGFSFDSNIGQMSFPAVQAAPCFPTSFPHMFGTRKAIRCLIPCAIDQV